MNAKIACSFATVTFAAALLFGCASLQPGADPLVVRCEQLETNAASTLNLVVTIDNSARTFFATNLPPFHQFCESLRAPVVVNGIVYPQALGGIASLDAIKVNYEASRSSSNALYSAVVALESTVGQATQWLSQLTNRPSL